MPRPPDMYLYYVQQRGTDKEKFWHQCGVAWKNPDGSYSLKFNLIPPNWDGSNIVMKAPLS